MSVALAVLVGLLFLGLASYIAILLHLIRRRGYGEGRLVEIAELGISLRYPDWWSVVPTADEAMCPSRSATARSQGTAVVPLTARAASTVAAESMGRRAAVRKGDGVSFRTGNHDGVLTLGLLNPAQDLAGRKGD